MRATVVFMRWARRLPLGWRSVSARSRMGTSIISAGKGTPSRNEVLRAFFILSVTMTCGGLIFQAFTVMLFGIVLGIPLPLAQVLAIIPALILVALFGASFGALIVSLLPNQRSANLLFPFVFLPQFFLAGAFNPIRNLPWYLDIVSHIAPLRYAVDLIRGAYYGYPNPAVLADPLWTTGLISILTVVMLSVGTLLFVRSERNR